MTTWMGATALVVIGAQVGFDDESYFGPRSNPSAEANIALLLDGWKSQNWPIVTVRYDPEDKASPVHPSKEGNRYKGLLAEVDPVLEVATSVSSAFYGEPDLDGWMRANELRSMAICGSPIHTLCESTARMASDLGYEVLYILDAMHTYDLTASDGTTVRGREVARLSGITIASSFGQVVYTAELVG
jgi:nicotinamidase-related amidase